MTWEALFHRLRGDAVDMKYKQYQLLIGELYLCLNEFPRA